MICLLLQSYALLLPNLLPEVLDCKKFCYLMILHISNMSILLTNVDKLFVTSVTSADKKSKMNLFIHLGKQISMKREV